MCGYFAIDTYALSLSIIESNKADQKKPDKFHLIKITKKAKPQIRVVSLRSDFILS